MCVCSGSASSTAAFVTILQVAFLAQPSLASAWFVAAKYCQNMQIKVVYIYNVPCCCLKFACDRIKTSQNQTVPSRSPTHMGNSTVCTIHSTTDYFLIWRLGIWEEPCSLEHLRGFGRFALRVPQRLSQRWSFDLIVVQANFICGPTSGLQVTSAIQRYY